MQKENQPHAEPPAYEAYLTSKELAQRWRVSIETIKRRRKASELPFHKMGGAVRFRLSDVIAYESATRI